MRGHEHIVHGRRATAGHRPRSQLIEVRAEADDACQHAEGEMNERPDDKQTEQLQWVSSLVEDLPHAKANFVQVKESADSNSSK
jgi:hypothetical protein